LLFAATNIDKHYLTHAKQFRVNNKEGRDAFFIGDIFLLNQPK